MPAASASQPRSQRTARGRTASLSAPRRRTAAARSAPRVRWDRLARVALLSVLVAVLYLYVSAGVRMLSTWQQARHDRALVSALALEHRALVHQRSLLGSRSALEAEARQLGMMYKGERSYVIPGLPGN